MNSIIRSASSIARFAALAGLLSSAALAHANNTNAAFVDVVNSVSVNGFNDLASTRITTANLVAGIASNVAGSDGLAVFKRTSGTAYPASTGLYEWGSPRSTFEISIQPVADVSAITFQSLVNVSTGANNIWGLLSAGNLPQLSYNGGNQLLSATTQNSMSVAFTDMTGTASPADPSNPNHSIFNWDLSSLNVPLTSLRLTFATDAHAQGQAFQLDQLVSTSAVPEPGSYALMFGGLGMVGFLMARRRLS